MLNIRTGENFYINQINSKMDLCGSNKWIMENTYYYFHKCRPLTLFTRFFSTFEVPTAMTFRAFSCAPVPELLFGIFRARFLDCFGYLTDKEVFLDFRYLRRGGCADGDSLSIWELPGSKPTIDSWSKIRIYFNALSNSMN